MRVIEDLFERAMSPRYRVRHFLAIALLVGAISAGYGDVSLKQGVVPYFAAHQRRVQVNSVIRDLRQTYVFINANRYSARSADVAHAFREHWQANPQDPIRMAAYAYAHHAATNAKAYDELCDDNPTWRSSLVPFAEEANVCRRQSFELLPDVPEVLVMAAEGGWFTKEGRFRWKGLGELLEKAIDLSPDWYAPYILRAELHSFTFYERSQARQDIEFQKGIESLSRAERFSMPLEGRYHLEWVRRRLYMFQQRDYTRAKEAHQRGFELAKQIGASPRRLNWISMFLKCLEEQEAEARNGKSEKTASQKPGSGS